MRRTKKLLAVAPSFAVAIAVLSSASAIADVRVVEDPDATTPPILEIVLSPDGPWSLVAPFDDTVLNPSGDAFGDSVPADAAQGTDLLATWVRPSDGLVQLSRWVDAGWSTLDPFIDEAAIGVPRLATLGTGWAVTWQQHAGDPVIRAAGVGNSGEHGDSEPITLGWLLDVSWIDDLQLILHENPERTKLFMTGVLWSVPGVPSPVDIVFTIELGDLNVDAKDRFRDPTLTLLERPDGREGRRFNGSWDQRVAVTWWNPESEQQQATVDQWGDVRHLNRPRHDLGDGSASPDGR